MRHLKYVRKDKSFHDYIVYDILGILTGVTSKAMFGGWAIYKGGTIFGIIAGGELYFKVDDENRVEFEKLESHPFVYTKTDRKRITMSYWLVPEEIIEDREKLVVLVEQSVAVSRYVKTPNK